MPGYRTTELPVWGFDIETSLLSEADVCPPPICLAVAGRTQTDRTKFDMCVLGNGDADFWQRIERTLQRCAENTLAIVGQTINYDMGSIAKARPSLFPLIFRAYAAGNIHDVETREKLLNLSTHGQLEYASSPDGTKTLWLRYRLQDHVLKYLGRDRSAEKLDEDSWRKHFDVLDGKPAAEYPKDAQRYVAADALDALLVFEAQDAVVESPDGGPASLRTQEFQAGVAFCLRLMTLQGIPIDPLEFTRIESDMQKILSNEAMKTLIDAGILRPAVPERPKTGGRGTGKAAIEERAALGLPPLMAKAKPSSVDTKVLKAHVERICNENGVHVKHTPEGHVQCSDDVISELVAFCPILKKFAERAHVQKIVTTYLPAMRAKDGSIAKRVHANFSVLVETGRTSSWGDDNYPSTNVQNQDPRTRGCFVPDENWVFVSTDVSGMELVGHGWKCKELFGRSSLLELLNAGEDAHAYLAAQIAFALNTDFNTYVRQQFATPTKWDIYGCFKLCKKSENPEVVKFYKHYRKLAKPTGLGYPGGLGPKTFITYARGSFDVKCTLEEATKLREIWFDSYEEMKPYFDWISTNCQDPRNPVVGHKDGKPIKGYAYFSPMGMYRAGCTFTAAANGAGLQTPAAEAAKLAVWDVTRAAYDPTLDSCLYGIRPLAFIHDEIFAMIPRDNYMHERAQEISRLMAGAIGKVFTGATIRCEPALMERWNKDAEPTYGPDGRLTIWRPKEVA